MFLLEECLLWVDKTWKRMLKCIYQYIMMRGY